MKKKPTQEQKKYAINRINKRINGYEMNRWINESIKKGYIKAVEILESDYIWDEEEVRISLGDYQAFVIANLAIEYIKGNVSHRRLCNVPTNVYAKNLLF